LFFNFALQNKGVSAADYQTTVEAVAGTSFQSFFDEYFYGTRPFESILVDSFEYLGIELCHEPSPIYSEGRLGFKAVKTEAGFIIKAMFPGGPAETAGLMLEDEIIAINDIRCDDELDKWFRYFDDDVKKLTVQRAKRIMTLTLPEVNRYFYNRYRLNLEENPNSHQQKALRHWMK
jgi:predicted metalloprotease with PDZ domain